MEKTITIKESKLREICLGYPVNGRPNFELLNRLIAQDVHHESDGRPRVETIQTYKDGYASEVVAMDQFCDNAAMSLDIYATGKKEDRGEDDSFADYHQMLRTAALSVCDQLRALKNFSHLFGEGDQAAEADDYNENH